MRTLPVKASWMQREWPIIDGPLDITGVDDGGGPPGNQNAGMDAPFSQEINHPPNMLCLDSSKNVC